MFSMLFQGLEVIWRVDGSMSLKRFKIGFLLRYRSTGCESRSTGFVFVGQPVGMYFLAWAFFTIAVDRSQGPIDRSTADLSFCFGALISTVGSFSYYCIYGILLPSPLFPKILLSLSFLLLLHSTTT